MKKVLCFVLALCVFALCSCSSYKLADTDNSIENKDAVTENATDSNDKEAPDTTHAAETEKETETRDEQQKPEEEKKDDIGTMIESLGATEGNGGDYFSDAELFSKCLQFRAFDIIVQYTGGTEDCYDFLNDVEIAGFKIYPIEISAEVTEQKAKEECYLTGEDMYLVEYDVTKGDGVYFKDGKNVYLMIFGIDPIAPGSLKAFVPYEQAENHIFFSIHKYSEYESYFVKEFASLYGSKLSDGKNYPDSFDFNESVHLITHLMARSGKYNEMPPYTLDEIEEFITESFDGNKGLTFTEYRDYERWVSVYPRPEGDILAKGARYFGCAYAHGGTTVENSIISEEWENKYTKTVTMQLYSDYSNFARAKQLVFTFEITDNELPRLVLVMQNNNTGCEAVVVSV